MEAQSRENARKAQAIIDLYSRLKSEIIALTHSRFAVPLLDSLFDQPIFTSSAFDNRSGMPGKPMIMNMLGRLKKAGILKVVRESCGRRGQVLALAELIDICEGADII